MRRLLLLLLFFILPSASFAELPVPKLAGRVNDLAVVIPPHLRVQLESKLTDFERETSNQVVILTVPSLEDDEIFSFTQRTFEAWKLGQKGIDNGVLIVAVKDRIEKGLNKSIRIHTGRGLEGPLPDVVCTRIVVDLMKPLFKEGKYLEGFNSGIDAVISATKGEFTAAKSGTTENIDDTSAVSAIVIIGGLVLIFIGSIFTPVLSGFVALGMSVYFVPASVGLLQAIAIHTAVFLVGWFVGWMIHQIMRSGSSSGGLDFSSGSWSSGSSGSSSGSSSGGFFSGGGGDSGGGGGGD